MRAGRQNAALGARWKEASRELGIATFVGTLRDEPALLASVRAEPDARAAVDALAMRPLRTDQDPELDLWALGDALGHAELAARHVAARTDARTRTALQVAAHMTPWRTSVTVQLGWLEGAGGS